MLSYCKTPVSRIFSAVFALFLAFSAGGCFHVLLFADGAYYTVSAIAELCALVFAGFYYLRGFPKDAAKYYRLFMLFYAFTFLAETAAGALTHDSLGVSTDDPVMLIVTMILYGNVLILAVAKDLGRAVSLTLCAVSAAIYLVPLIGIWIPGTVDFATDAAKTANILLYVVWFAQACNALLMTLAKYMDKAARGTN